MDHTASTSSSAAHEPRTAVGYRPSTARVVFCAFEGPSAHDPSPRPVRQISVDPAVLRPAPDATAMLDQLYERFNHVDGGSRFGDLARAEKTRSLSCGDVIHLDKQAWICADMGWHEVSPTDAERWATLSQDVRLMRSSPEAITKVLDGTRSA